MFYINSKFISLKRVFHYKNINIKFNYNRITKISMINKKFHVRKVQRNSKYTVSAYLKNEISPKQCIFENFVKEKVKYVFFLQGISICTIFIWNTLYTHIFFGDWLNTRKNLAMSEDKSLDRFFLNFINVCNDHIFRKEQWDCGSIQVTNSSNKSYFYFPIGIM